MASNVTTAWIAPPLSMFEPRNCTLGSSWAAAALRLIHENRTIQDVPLLLTVEYLRAAIPQNWTHPPRTGDILAWYAVHRDFDDPKVEEFWDKMIEFPLEECNTAICAQLDWTGDPEISGEGMMISYYIVAIMSLIWFIAINVGELSYLKNHRIRRKRAAKVLRGFQEASYDFLDAALVFSAAMHLATITRYARVVANEERTYSAYSLLGSVFMSTFTIFPALVLQTVTDRLRKHWLRIILWFVIIASSIITEVFYVIVGKRDHWGWFTHEYYSNRPIHFRELVWQRVCEGNENRERMMHLLSFGHVWLGLNLIWWIWYVIASVVPNDWKDKRRGGRWYDFFKSTQKILIITNGCICVLTMFAFLGLYHYYTNHVSEMAGLDMAKDGTWTFGQVLALATWVPVIVQFISISLFGKKGLNARLSARYEVVETREPYEKMKNDASSQSLGAPPFERCDQAKPACTRCARLQIQCVGAGVQRFHFVEFSAAPRPGATAGGEQSAVMLRQPTSSPILLVSQEFVQGFHGDDMRYDLSIYGPFLQGIPARLGQSKALDASVSAVGWIGSKDIYVLKHGEAVAFILRKVSNINSNGLFENQLVLTLIVPMVMDAMMNPNIVLGPWIHELLDKYMAGLGPDQPKTTYESCSLRNIVRLPSVIRDPLRHMPYIGIAYETVRGDVARMRQTYALVQNIYESSPESVKNEKETLRMYSGMQTVAGIILMVANLFGGLLAAYDPSNTAVVEEANLYRQESLALAKSAAMHRPFGSSYMTLTLVTAWAASDDAEEMAELWTAIEEYASDFPEDGWQKRPLWLRSVFDTVRMDSFMRASGAISPASEVAVHEDYCIVM
ncbi:hypothetical protein HJFPF1_04148 [Paramyrothecium foliicola]|nr:hypothetical protein HJFPF1_04148 [Paramyrothecium foliicola]